MYLKKVVIQKNNYLLIYHERFFMSFKYSSNLKCFNRCIDKK